MSWNKCKYKKPKEGTLCLVRDMHKTVYVARYRGKAPCIWVYTSIEFIVGSIVEWIEIPERTEEEIRADERRKIAEEVREFTLGKIVHSTTLYNAIVGGFGVTVDGVRYESTQTMERSGSDAITIEFYLTLLAFDTLLESNGSKEAVIVIERPGGTLKEAKGRFSVGSYVKYENRVECIAIFVPLRGVE